MIVSIQKIFSFEEIVVCVGEQFIFLYLLEVGVFVEWVLCLCVLVGGYVMCDFLFFVVEFVDVQYCVLLVGVVVLLFMFEQVDVVVCVGELLLLVECWLCGVVW